MVQNTADNRIAFIVSGETEVRVNGRKVAVRRAGHHVGEMSLIDPSARRSASVVATADSVVAWVAEAEFVRIANEHPELWRALAVELAARIRQRGAEIFAPNEQPEIFLGSSSESKYVAEIIKAQLASDPFRVHLWTDGVFDASEAFMESLEKYARKVDFAVLVLTADDLVKKARQKFSVPRDNVIFELGFMGAIRRHRTFMVVENGAKIHLPSDLSGITYLPFEKARVTDTVRQSVDRIRQRVLDDGPR
jgi:predicted nucleotide-binding protein